MYANLGENKKSTIGLMKKSWGEKIANLRLMEVDDHGRAWGPYLRVKVKLDITRPLRRGVSIYSAKRQAK